MTGLEILQYLILAAIIVTIYRMWRIPRACAYTIEQYRQDLADAREEDVGE